MGRQILMSSLNTCRMALILASPLLKSVFTRSLKSVSASATAALRAIIVLAGLALEPVARNSKRLPVKAKGDVRLRSVSSTLSSGIWGTSRRTACLPSIWKSSSFVACSILSRSSEICEPKKLEIIAGGASQAPRRGALVALIIEAFSTPLWRYTPKRVSTTKVIKRRLSSGVLPGA